MKVQFELVSDEIIDLGRETWFMPRLSNAVQIFSPASFLLIALDPRTSREDRILTWKMMQHSLQEMADG